MDEIKDPSESDISDLNKLDNEKTIGNKKLEYDTSLSKNEQENGRMREKEVYESEITILNEQENETINEPTVRLESETVLLTHEPEHDEKEEKPSQPTLEELELLKPNKTSQPTLEELLKSNTTSGDQRYSGRIVLPDRRESEVNKEFWRDYFSGKYQDVPRSAGPVWMGQRGLKVP